MTSWATLDTQSRVAAIKEHIAANPKARDQDIANALGTSRDSISWHIRTYSIKRALSGGDKRRKNPPRTGWKPVTFGTPLSPVPTLPRDVNARAFEPLPGATPPKALHLLERHECHWPVGEGFCGCYAETGRYCATHTKMSGKMVPRLVIA